ncbi:uncharacterized protein LOC102721168 isoform X2 [Oryza brachyantha]|uniref:uncharacterized protein LOC102721168 isoform X2 n=1 Tax=Oryza brachyantha TaxID=4533 RepID=UPI001ADB4030|nr:uncharacterized protein LOC102721168 isoform X2 [Oryza brachyantha]
MKSGSSAAAPAAGGNSLAIAERQKPAPSCVASLFQMLAKRKLFSSSSKKTKLLPPVRTQKFSPGRLPAGGEKTPAAKMRTLLLDSPYNPNEVTSRLSPPGQNNRRSEMCTPGVVAQLMGLSSMPATSHHQKAAKAIDASELGGHRNECSYRSIHNSHQKPGQLRDGRHDNGSHCNADVQPSWSRKHAHKVASPIKSPRSISGRNKARLIEAAVKVLEPGLQSRHRRHARLEYRCNDNGVQGVAGDMHKFSDQFSREMCDVDASRSGAQDAGATSLHKTTSNQWSEEETKRNASVRRPNQSIPCQAQSEGNHKGQRNGFKDDAQRTSDASQGAQKMQPKNISRENVACRPLKQNNLKQNALPETYRAADTGHMVQKQKHRAGEQNVANTASDFVCLNRAMNNSASLRSKGKVMDKIYVPHSSAEEEKNLSTRCQKTGGLHGDRSNKLKLKTATPRATEKDMIFAKGAGLVSEKPKSTSPNSVRNESRRKAESRIASRGNNSGIVSIASNSPRKVVSNLLNGHSKGSDSVILGSPTSSCPKRDSSSDCQNMSSQGELVSREALQGISTLESAESICFNRNEFRNRDILRDRVTSSLFQKTSAAPPMEESPNDEFLRQCHLVDSLLQGFRDLPRSVGLRGTHKMHEATTKASDQSHYTDDDHISGSLPDTASTAAEAGWRSQRRSETCTVQDATAKRHSRCAETKFGQDGVQLFDPAFRNSSPKHPGEVAATVELLLKNVGRPTQRRSKAHLKAFLVQTSESALTTLTASSKEKTKKKNVFFSNAGGDGGGRRSPLGKLAFDSAMELLDTMFIQFCDSGYRSFTRLALLGPEERLAAQVSREIARCSAMAGKPLDDVIASDVQHAAAAEAGVGSLHEVFQIGAQIERDLLQELVAEIGVDVLRRL